MALTCARCGTQNPDGNAFCQACGTQLAATAWAAPTAAPGTPPAGAPPPNWAPPQGPPPQSAQPAAPWLPPQSAPPPVAGPPPSAPPAGTPSPVGQQTPSKGGANAASTSSVSATVPPGWVATTKDPVLQVTNPAGTGTIVMSSGSQTAQSAQQMKDAADQSLINQFPDIKACPNTKTTSGSVGGVSGIWWELCFTSTSGGQSFAGAMTIFVGV